MEAMENALPGFEENSVVSKVRIPAIVNAESRAS